MEDKKKFDIISSELFPKLKYTNISQPGFIIMFSAIPGSGKTTLAKAIEERYKVVRLSSDDIMRIITEQNLVDTIHENEILKGDYAIYLSKNMAFDNNRIILDMNIDRLHKRIISLCKKLNLPYFIIRLNISKEEAIKRIKAREQNRNMDNWVPRMDKWLKDHEELGKNIKPDIEIDGDKNNLDKIYGLLDKELNKS